MLNFRAQRIGWGLVLAAALLARYFSTQPAASESWTPARGDGACEAEAVPWSLRRLRHEPWPELVRRVHAETGVRIAFECPEGYEVRLGWHQDWETLPEELRARSVLLAWHQLRAYEPSVLGTALEQLIIVRGLSTQGGAGLHGFAASGTGIAFVHWEGLLRGTVLHHEIGHLLDDAHLSPFDRESWRWTLPPGFTYSHARDRDGRLDRGERQGAPLEGWPSRGFVRSYSTTAFEEDFATIFAWELTCPSTLATAAQEHELLRPKRKLLHELLQGMGLPRD